MGISSNAGCFPASGKEAQVSADIPHLPGKRTFMRRPKSTRRHPYDDLELARCQTEGHGPRSGRQLPAAGARYLAKEQGFREVKPINENSEPSRNMPLWTRAREVPDQLEKEVATHGCHGVEPRRRSHPEKTEPPKPQRSRQTKKPEKSSRPCTFSPLKACQAGVHAAKLATSGRSAQP